MQLRLYKGKKELIGQEFWTKRQRDAYYFGYLAGQEAASHQLGIKMKTHLLVDLHFDDPLSLRRKLNYFFLQKGYSLKEKDFYWEGVQIGVFSVKREKKEKHSQQV